MNGILVINKDKEFTSFDVVAVVRKLTGQRKIGHCGTLDPNATGVLPLLLGNATKAQDIILNHDKSYVAEFELGKTTDTLDIWGELITQNESFVIKDELLSALESFQGEIMQTPPMYSAIKKDGKRLYDLARQGIEVERESRKVTVYSLELISFDESTQKGKISVSCSKGTYIRSIIDDLGKKLSVGAVMTSLERTCACGYDLSKAITLSQLKDICENGSLQELLQPVESLFSTLGYVAVSEKQAKRFSNGGSLDIERTYLKKGYNDKDIYRIKDRENNFLGLGICDAETGQIKIYKLF